MATSGSFQCRAHSARAAFSSGKAGIPVRIGTAQADAQIGGNQRERARGKSSKTPRKPLASDFSWNTMRFPGMRRTERALRTIPATGRSGTCGAMPGSGRFGFAVLHIPASDVLRDLPASIAGIVAFCDGRALLHHTLCAWLPASPRCSRCARDRCVSKPTFGGWACFIKIGLQHLKDAETITIGIMNPLAQYVCILN